MFSLAGGFLVCPQLNTGKFSLFSIFSYSQAKDKHDSVEQIQKPKFL
jgi:hypothetical protein